MPIIDEYRPLRRDGALVGFMVLVLGVLLGSWILTQQLAGDFGFASTPIVHVGPWAIYAPWDVFQWAWQYHPKLIALQHHYYPNPKTAQLVIQIFASKTRLAEALGVFALLAAIGAYVWEGSKEQPTTGSHGTARWATRREIKRGGFFTQSAFSVYLGLYKPHWWSRGQCLFHSGPEPVMGVAPTRAGKGLTIVIPTLLDYAGSVVAHDTKGDLCKKTRRARGAYGPVFAFEPASPNSHRYNPLDAIRSGTAHAADDANNLAGVVVTSGRESASKDHWEDSAIPLAAAVVLHILDTSPVKTLRAVYEFFGQDHDQLFEQLAASNHSYVAAIGREIGAVEQKERSSIVSTAARGFRLYATDLMDRATSASDFTAETFRDPQRPASLFLIAGEGDAKRVTPLLRLVATQLVNRFMQNEQHRQHILLMLDECASLDIPTLPAVLSKIAGYGVKAYLLYQNLNQIYDTYGERQTIVGQCAVRVYFAPNDMETAEYASKALGMRTIKVHSQSTSVAQNQTTYNTSVTEIAQPLLNPAQIKTMGQQLVIDVTGLEDGFPVIKARKFDYRKRPEFAGRVDDPTRSHA